MEQHIENSAHGAVLAHIEAGILDGRFRSGDLLPSERSLAKTLKVGRPAVREAMRALAAQGLIASFTGRGGGNRLSPTQGNALARTFRLHLAVANQGIAALTETRIALERASAAEAARKVNKTTVAELDEILASMKETTDSGRFNHLDTDFHVTLARAGDNPLVTDLTIAIRETLRDPIHALESQMPDWLDFRTAILAEHEAIRDAVASEDPELASRKVEEHIRAAYDRLLRALSSEQE